MGSLMLMGVGIVTAGGSGPSVGDGLLLETGIDFVLLEDGTSFLLLEA